MGRNAAGESFLRGFLTHSQASEFWVQVQTPGLAGEAGFAEGVFVKILFIFAGEVRPQIGDADWARVHFIPLLQLSSVHVYLTYPFVLSWSLLEAMSIGCAIVASDTPPLREAISHDETGRLVNFFDVAGLANAVCLLLDDASARERLRAQARRFARSHYDLKTVCLPQQLAWVEGLAGDVPPQ